MKLRSISLSPVVVVIAMLCVAMVANAADVRVAAASDLSFAIKEIIAQYERESGNHVLLTLGSSGTFFAQISEGAPFDVFLSADKSYPALLIDKKLAEPDSQFIYGVGKIVLWFPNSVPVDATRLGMQSLLQPSIRKIAIANPAHAPYGRAAVAAMQGSGVYERVKDRLVLGENISQAAEFVQSGAAQAGIIALSLALSEPMRKSGRYWEIPQSSYPLLEQSAIVLRRARDSKNLEAAQSFIRSLKSPATRAILDRYGFTAARP